LALTSGVAAFECYSRRERRVPPKSAQNGTDLKTIRCSVTKWWDEDAGKCQELRVCALFYVDSGSTGGRVACVQLDILVITYENLYS